MKELFKTLLLVGMALYVKATGEPIAIGHLMVMPEGMAIPGEEIDETQRT